MGIIKGIVNGNEVVIELEDCKNGLNINIEGDDIVAVSINKYPTPLKHKIEEMNTRHLKNFFYDIFFNDKKVIKSKGLIIEVRYKRDYIGYTKKGVYINIFGENISTLTVNKHPIPIIQKIKKINKMKLGERFNNNWTNRINRLKGNMWYDNKDEKRDLIRKFIREHKYNKWDIFKHEIFKFMMEEASVRFTNKHYTASWEFENPDGIYIHAEMLDYMRLIEEKKDMGFCLEELNANFYDDKCYEDSFNQMCSDLSKFDIETINLARRWRYINYCYFIPFKEFEKLFDILKILETYNNQIGEEFDIIDMYKE